MIKLVCPKCNQEGKQHIIINPKKSSGRYLEYIHKTRTGLRRCYIGKIRTTKEALDDLDRGSTEEEMSEALNSISEEIRKLIKSYSPNTAISVLTISKKLEKILSRYGC